VTDAVSYVLNISLVTVTVKLERPVGTDSSAAAVPETKSKSWLYHSKSGIHECIP